MKLTFEYDNLVTFPVDYVEGLEKLKISIKRETDTGQRVVSGSSELTFIGKDYEYVYSKLFDNPEAFNKELYVNIYDECCDVEYPFIALPENCDIDCNTCSLSITLTEYTDESQIYRCLTDTMIYENNDFIKKEHPRFVYCDAVKPEWLHYVVLILGMAVIGMIASFTILVYQFAFVVKEISLIVDAIIWLVNVFGGNWSAQKLDDLPKDIIDGFNQFEQGITDNILGCGHTHPSPLVRDYLDNICKSCGISWNSSIFSQSRYNGDYYDLCLWSGQVTKGTPIGNTGRHWVDKDKPILNGTEFLKLIISPFNAEWRIINKVLIIERHDYLYSGTPCINLDNIKGGLDECRIRWANDRQAAYGEFQYSLDPFDNAGNEAKSRFNSIVGWNTPYSPLQSGKKTVMLDGLSPVRAIGDKVPDYPEIFDLVTDDAWQHVPVIKRFTDYADAMLLSKGRGGNYKLLIWDRAKSDTDNALIKRDWTANILQPDGTIENASPAVNYPMWLQGNSVEKGNLYDRFWQIENPRQTLLKNWYIEATFGYNCEILKALDVNGIAEKGGNLGKIIEIEIDSANKTIKLCLMM